MGQMTYGVLWGVELEKIKGLEPGVIPDEDYDAGPGLIGLYVAAGASGNGCPGGGLRPR